MSRLVARLLLSLLLMPVASLVYLFTFFVLDRLSIGQRFDEQTGFGLAGAVTFAGIIAYWLGLWSGVVTWNTGRRTLTGLAVPGAALIGAAVYAVVCALDRRYNDHSFAAFVGSVSAPLLWMTATVLIWRETPRERSERLRGVSRGGITCPTCGYNLTGLTSTRCPECGTQFTLEELIAEGAGKSASDLEAV